MSSENTFGEAIYSYSRKQAIEDGVLVDLSLIDSVKQHWKYHERKLAPVMAANGVFFDTTLN